MESARKSKGTYFKSAQTLSASFTDFFAESYWGYSLKDDLLNSLSFALQAHSQKEKERMNSHIRYGESIPRHHRQ